MNALPGARCAQSLQLNGALWRFLEGPAPPIPRHALVASAASLAHEHHSGIARLMQTQHYAAAAALVRPQVEAVTTAAWALYIPQPAMIEDLLWDRAKRPKFSRMLSHLDSRPELHGKLDLKLLMDGPGTLLHELTHGDMHQLRRRFRMTGSTFDLRENTGTLLVSDLMVMLAASIYEVTRRAPGFAEFIEARTNGLVEEIRALGGVPLDEWKGWQPLPSPMVQPGGAPADKGT